MGRTIPCLRLSLINRRKGPRGCLMGYSSEPGLPKPAPSPGPLLISRAEAERIRRAHAEARYRKERKTRIGKARKHLGLALHWVDRLIELERSAKDPALPSRKAGCRTLIQALNYLSLLRRSRRPNIVIGGCHVLVAHHITDREGVVSPVLQVRGEEGP